jgi:hypothetical protein
MLLESYHLEIYNSECNPSGMAVHCFAHLNQDAGEAILYQNAVGGGFTHIKEPPSVTFNDQGKLITVKQLQRMGSADLYSLCYPSNGWCKRSGGLPADCSRKQQKTFGISGTV